MKTFIGSHPGTPLLCLIVLLGLSMKSNGADLSVVPLFDGERMSMLNNWGGPFNTGNIVDVALETSIFRSGKASYRADLGTIGTGGFGFFQTFSSATTGMQDLRQTRDLTRYDSFEGYVRNDTGSPFNLKFEIKDYRDDLGHQVFQNFSIPAGAGWTKISASMDINSAGWSTVGNPDLSRTYVNSFVITPTAGSVSGNIYLDDFQLTESGGSIDIQTAPLNTIVERLAERQFRGLWDGRNRVTGLIYNSKNSVNAAAMNTTGGVLWMLPKAVERGWVDQTQADTFATQVAASLDTNLNQTSFLPTRFINPATAGLPGGSNEESSIDASFIALALHRYKMLPTTSPALFNAIDDVQNRFQLDAFTIPAGFRMAYFPSTGFTSGTYNGYTNEGKVISLAAELSDDHHVPLEDHWNADTNRARSFLVNPDDAHLVHSSTNFRAPFEQSLLNLFVDTSERGVDNYPTRSLATNPWQNYLRYEREVAAKLEQLGRDSFFQPDAGSGDPFSSYEQYSLYKDFGQPDLFMPWSVSLALLAGAEGAEDALRSLLLVDGIQGPLGLPDSVRWNTGDPDPYFVSNSGDNWNTVLSTMSLLEFLDQSEGQQSASEFLATLTNVEAALDNVFIDGDLNGDGITDEADLSIWEAGYGDEAGATPASGDADGDGDVDGADFLRWQRGAGASLSAQIVTIAKVPEPALHWLLAPVVLLALRSRNLKARVSTGSSTASSGPECAM